MLFNIFSIASNSESGTFALIFSGFHQNRLRSIRHDDSHCMDLVPSHKCTHFMMYLLWGKDSRSSSDVVQIHNNYENPSLK